MHQGQRGYTGCRLPCASPWGPRGEQRGWGKAGMKGQGLDSRGVWGPAGVEVGLASRDEVTSASTHLLLCRAPTAWQNPGATSLPTCTPCPVLPPTGLPLAECTAASLPAAHGVPPGETPPCTPDPQCPGAWLGPQSTRRAGSTCVTLTCHQEEDMGLCSQGIKRLRQSNPKGPQNQSATGTHARGVLRRRSESGNNSNGQHRWRRAPLGPPRHREAWLPLPGSCALSPWAPLAAWKGQEDPPVTAAGHHLSLC